MVSNSRFRTFVSQKPYINNNSLILFDHGNGRSPSNAVFGESQGARNVHSTYAAMAAKAKPRIFVGRRKRFSRCDSLDFSPWPYDVCATKAIRVGGWIAAQKTDNTKRPNFK